MKFRSTYLSILVAFVFATLLIIVVPLQTYLGNQDMFTFGVRPLVLELVVLFLPSFAILSLILVRIEKYFGKYPLLIMVALSIWFFLESGILSFGLPQLNGGLDQFSKPTIRKYIDIGVLCGLVAVFVIFRSRILAWLPWICGAFGIMMLASLIDANVPCVKIMTTDFDDGMVSPKSDVLQSATFSAKKNVIVLLLDAAPADMASDILERDNALQKKFKGFVAYRNNIGMHEKTIRGMPAVFTGKYLEKYDTTNDQLLSVWGCESALRNYRDNGYAMYVLPGMFSKGYTNRRVLETPKKERESAFNILKYTEEAPYINLLDVVVYRLIPYRFKLDFISSAMGKGFNCCEQGLKCTREWDAYTILKQSSTVRDDMTFHFYHTAGVHVPIRYDRYGNSLGLISESDDSIRDLLYYLLEQVGSLMDSLREKGVYENTLVVLTTDHGICRDPRSALLMIKPINAVNDFSISDLPTSHSKIAALLKESAVKDLTIDEIDSILKTDERRLRIKQQTPEKWWYFGREFETYDIYFDNFGNETNRVNLGVFETI